MGWLLRLLILVAAIYLLYRFLVGGRAIAGGGGPRAANDEGALLRCNRCGTLVPREMAVIRDERPYCGPACVEAAKREPPDR